MRWRFLLPCSQRAFPSGRKWERDPAPPPADHDTVATSRKAIAKEQTMRHANSPPHLPVSPLFVVIPQRSPSPWGSLSLQALCPHTYKYTLQQVINFLLCKYSYMIYSFPSYRFQFCKKRNIVYFFLSLSKIIFNLFLNKSNIYNMLVHREKYSACLFLKK